MDWSCYNKKLPIYDAIEKQTMEVKGVRGRKTTQNCKVLRNRRIYWELKEEAKH